MPIERSLTLTPSDIGLPDGWTPGRFHDELEQAAASLSQPAVACTSLRLVVAPPATRRIAQEDGMSLVVFRKEQWCHNSRCGHLETFPFRAMAMTETHPVAAGDGAIGEADIELNAAHFRFTAATAPRNPEERTVPLRAVLLHELGHAVGLEDRCVPEGSHGVHAAVPDLDRCGPHEGESIMFAPALNLALSPLDIGAICAAHPAPGAAGLALPPHSLRSDSTGGSALGALPQLALGLLLTVLLVRVGQLSASALRRRARRPGGSAPVAGPH